jgi:hypothetical protein
MVTGLDAERLYSDDDLFALPSVRVGLFTREELDRARKSGALRYVIGAGKPRSFGWEIAEWLDSKEPRETEQADGDQQRPA